MVLPLDIEGPVRAEVFVVTFDGGIRLTGPCGPAPWHIETHGNAHPLDLVRSMVERVMGGASLVHSTSWRWESDAVVLSFVAVVEPALVGQYPVESVEQVGLARSSATAAPSVIGWRQVLEHGIRHLAWLAREDPHVAEVLSDSWHLSLRSYVPAPFQQLETLEV